MSKSAGNNKLSEGSDDRKSVLLSRRHLIAAGVIALGGVAVGRHDILRVLTPQSEAAEPRNKIAPVLSKDEREYQEWSKTIHLPKIEETEAEMKLPEIPEEKATPEKLNSFYMAFDGLWLKFQRDMEAEQKPEARERIIFNFLGMLVAHYKLAIGDNEEEKNLEINSQKFTDLMLNVQSFLVRHGHFVEARVDKPSLNLRVSHFRVGTVNKLEISDEGKEYAMPLIHLEGQEDFNSDPHEVIERGLMNGLYNQMDQTMLIDSEGRKTQYQKTFNTFQKRCQSVGVSCRFPDEVKMRKDFVRAVDLHEGMHAVLERRGFRADYKRYDAHKGDVSMGYFHLPARSLRERNNVEVHELAAIGYSLMHSESAAPIVVSSLIKNEKSTYQMAHSLVVESVMGLMSEEDRRKVLAHRKEQEVKLNVDQLMAVLHKIPLEKLHQLGERMAKLGLYLSQT